MTELRAGGGDDETAPKEPSPKKVINPIGGVASLVFVALAKKPDVTLVHSHLSRTAHQKYSVA